MEARAIPDLRIAAEKLIANDVQISIKMAWTVDLIHVQGNLL
jgi:hypothetical protein